MSTGAGERVQKVLARAGWGSRREIERWIADGRLRVNGRIAEPGAHVSPGDLVQLDGGRRMRIGESEQRIRVLAYHKPVGTVCTRRDPERRRTVFQDLPRTQRERWINVGRLDINTSGLLLFTNNGDLAHRLMHPRYRIDREYAARVYGEVPEGTLARLRAGVDVDGDRLAFADVVPGEGAGRDEVGEAGANRWYYCLVQSGRNREVRRLWESQGVRVSRLVRVRFANVMLPTDLRPGRYVELGGALLEDLCRLVGLRATPGAPNRGRRRAGPPDRARRRPSGPRT